MEAAGGEAEGDMCCLFGKASQAEHQAMCARFGTGKAERTVHESSRVLRALRCPPGMAQG